MNISDLVNASYSNAKAKGFHAMDMSSPVEKMMLMVSEISEAMEEWRSGHKLEEIYISDLGTPEGVPIELADVVIRVADFCGRYGIDLEKAIETKMAYNATRDFKHGGKRI